MIQTVRDSIEAGAPIEDLARRYSDDPGSAQRGGRYAEADLRELVPEFAAVAARLEPGQLSQPFQTEFGYHVMRLNARRGNLVDFNHVLIRIDLDRTDDSEALEVLEAVRDSVLAGASFAALARTFSEDEESAARGGNVTVPQTGSRDLRFEALNPSWQATLDTLEVGEVSAPTEVQLLDGRRAYHIALLQKRTPPHPLSLQTDFPLIEEFALQEKRQRELAAWVDELREGVYVDLKDEGLCPDGSLSARAGR
ncbi:MAG: peptidylprolyl isomerase, partial [Rhodothermales bacterium]|nr:peptidylprolyl isomerase [Rhodothermales bacterium]